MKLPDQIFVTGTDTDVGKTFVSAVLLSGLAKTHYWKPIQSGTAIGSDTEWIQTVADISHDRFYPERYRLEQPLSPHAAAELEEIEIDLNELNLPCSGSQPVVVEGAGGVMVPINGEHLMVDVMKRLALPVLVVARSGLGTINHTVLTVERLRSAELFVIGVVMNGLRNPSNRRAIERYGNVPVIAEIEPIECVTADQLRKTFSSKFEAALV